MNLVCKSFKVVRGTLFLMFNMLRNNQNSPELNIVAFVIQTTTLDS